MSIRFEWDKAKDRSNQAKHGIDFETAARVFVDPMIVIEQDRIEGGEYRWQATGMVKMLLLVVAHTLRDLDNNEVIRIISARRATKGERRRYERDG